MKQLRHLGGQARRARGLLGSVVALLIAWRAQTTYAQGNLAGAGLYLLAASVMIVSYLFTYRNHRFLRRGDYSPIAPEAAMISTPLPLRRILASSSAAPAASTTLRVRRAISVAPASAQPTPGLPVRRVRVNSEGSVALAVSGLPVRTRKVAAASAGRQSGGVWRQWLNWVSGLTLQQRLALGGVALLLSLATVLLNEQYPTSWLVIGLWIVSFVMFAIACSGQREGLWPLAARNDDEQEGGEDEGIATASGERQVGIYERSLLLLILLMAAVARIYGLSMSVFAMHFDETIVGLMTRSLMHGDLNIAPLFNGSVWYFFPSGTMWSMVPALVLFGDNNAAGLHFSGVLFSVLNVFAMYLLLRLLFNARVALIGAGLLATAPPILHLSLYALGNEQVEFFWTISAYFLFKGLRSKRYLDFVWSGYGAALSLLFYHTSRVIFVLIGVFIVYLIVTRFSLARNYRRQAGVFILAAWIIGAPTIYHTYSHPEVLLQRLGQVSIISPEGAATAFDSWHIARPAKLQTDIKSILANLPSWRDLLIQQAEHTYLALTFYDDHTYFYQTGKPLLPTPLAVLATLGIAYALWRWRDPRYFFISAWFWVGLFFSTMLTIYPPELLRMTGVVQVIYIFPAIVINKIVYEAGRTGWFERVELRQWRRSAGRAAIKVRPHPFTSTLNFIPANIASQPSYLNIITGLLVAALMTDGVHQYYDQFRAHTAQWADLNLTAYYLHSSPANNFHAYIEFWPESINRDFIMQYLDPKVEGDDVERVSYILPFSEQVDKDPLFILTRNHTDDGALISKLYPQARRQVVPYIDGQPFLNAYALSASYVNAQHGMRAGYFAGDNVDQLGQLLVSRQEPTAGLYGGNQPPANLQYPTVAVWEGAFYVGATGIYTMNLSAPNGWLAAAGQNLRLGKGQVQATLTLGLRKGWHPLSLRTVLTNASQQVQLTLTGAGMTAQPLPYYHLYPGSIAAVGTQLGNGGLMPREPAPIPNEQNAGNPNAAGPLPTLYTTCSTAAPSILPAFSACNA